MLTGYCKYCVDLPKDNVHRIYHDTQYGFPLKDDNELFGRLILEINQAGLSWNTILNKEQNFRRAYSEFDFQKIARYSMIDRERLLNDAGIIRNRLKVDAVIYNAQKVVSLCDEYGSFYSWLESKHPLNKEEWVKLFKKQFKFTGGEIVGEFLMSIGFLRGSHCGSCTVFDEINKKLPKWLEI